MQLDWNTKVQDNGNNGTVYWMDTSLEGIFADHDFLRANTPARTS